MLSMSSTFTSKGYEYFPNYGKWIDVKYSKKEAVQGVPGKRGNISLMQDSRFCQIDVK